jgi:hypothetical protein
MKLDANIQKVFEELNKGAIQIASEEMTPDEMIQLYERHQKLSGIFQWLQMSKKLTEEQKSKIVKLQ